LATATVAAVVSGVTAGGFTLAAVITFGYRAYLARTAATTGEPRKD